MCSIKNPAMIQIEAINAQTVATRSKEEFGDCDLRIISLPPEKRCYSLSGSLIKKKRRDGRPSRRFVLFPERNNASELKKSLQEKLLALAKIQCAYP